MNLREKYENVEFVVLLASSIAIIAFSIATLIPCFKDIQHDFHIKNAESLPNIIHVFMLGFAIGQLFYGPISDTFGRRRVFFAGILTYSVSTILIIGVDGYSYFLALRFVQGLGAASGRILPYAMMRDRYAGDTLANVMSYVNVIFNFVPMFAPFVGTVMLVQFGSWRSVFALMGCWSIAILIWSYYRLPETLDPLQRIALNREEIVTNMKVMLCHPYCMVYTFISGLIYGCLTGFMGGAAILYRGSIYDVGSFFNTLYAIIAIAYGLGMLANPVFILKYGTRAVAYCALWVYVIVSILFLGCFVYTALPSVVLYTSVLCIQMFCLGIVSINYKALALDPLGAFAGLGSSFVWFASLLVGTVGGWSITTVMHGSLFNFVLMYALFGVFSIVMDWIVHKFCAART